MTNRDRPRLNITLDRDLKKQLDEVASELDITRSRLIEDVVAEFLDLYEDDPMVGIRLRKSVTERKRQESTSGADQQAKEEIKQILDALDETENQSKN